MSNLLFSFSLFPSFAASTRSTSRGRQSTTYPVTVAALALLWTSSVHRQRTSLRARTATRRRRGRRRQRRRGTRTKRVASRERRRRRKREMELWMKKKKKMRTPSSPRRRRRKSKEGWFNVYGMQCEGRIQCQESVSQVGYSTSRKSRHFQGSTGSSQHD